MDAAKKLIMFDDREAGERVLLYRKTYKIGNAAGTLMNTGNLGRPAIYIPVRREGIDVLAMLQFRSWRSPQARFWVKRTAMS